MTDKITWTRHDDGFGGYSDSGEIDVWFIDDTVAIRIADHSGRETETATIRMSAQDFAAFMARAQTKTAC